MSHLLNLVYLALIIAASPWLMFQAVARGKYREGWAAKLLGLVPRRDGDRTCVWLHGVSVGEINLLIPLVAEIQRCWPGAECVVSSTTMTGLALARKRFPGLTLFYCPLDFTWAVRRAMRRVRPDLLVLGELELWPNLIAAAREAGARVAIVNGRLSERSYRGYRRLRPWIGRVLRRLDLIAVQNPTFARRFAKLGAPASIVHITGSLKFDGAQTDRGNPRTRQLVDLAGIEKSDVVFLAGSTQEPEEALALATFRELAPVYPRLRLILVPRHPHRFDEVAKLLDASGIRWLRRTALDRVQSDANTRVLLVDTVGELGSWWGTAAIAFVGGSLGSRGGQNMIEPAAYGAAVSFGPNTKNFREIVEPMLAKDAAVVVRTGDELTAFVRRCLEDHAYATRLGRNARTLVAAQLGATSRTVALLRELPDRQPPAEVQQRTAA